MSTSIIKKIVSFVATSTAFMAVVTLTTKPAQAVTIDFETLPGVGTISNGLAITNQYASQGVTFSAIEDNVEYASYIFKDFGSPGSAMFNMTTSYLFGNRADILRLSFTTLVDAVKLDYNPFGFYGDQTLFQAFNSGGTLIESLRVAGATGNSYVPVSFSSSGISRIDIIQPTEDWGYAIDNLQFEPQVTEPTPVPEPASGLGLLGLGILGGGSSLKRKLRR